VWRELQCSSVKGRDDALAGKKRPHQQPQPSKPVTREVTKVDPLCLLLFRKALGDAYLHPLPPSPGRA